VVKSIQQPFVKISVLCVMCINKEKTWKQTLTCSGFCCIGRFGHFFYSSNKLFI